jgi:rusticyanin
MLFGLFWGLDAGLKLIPGTAFWFQERMIAAGIGQPSWLSGWFAFWLSQANAYGPLDVALVGSFEFFLAVALIAGLLRKTAYLVGLILSLSIWAIPEGFGGPYDPGTFDIGVGIVYAIGFLFLIALDADPTSRAQTLDEKIEKRWPRWAAIAEVSGLSIPPGARANDSPVPPAGDVKSSPRPRDEVSPTRNPTRSPRGSRGTVLWAVVIGAIIALAGLATSYLVVRGLAPNAGGCPAATATNVNASSVSNATFNAENLPPPGVNVTPTANTITADSGNATLLVEGTPWWYPHTGDYFLSYGLVNPQFSVPTGTPIRFSFINMDSEPHTLTFTTQSPPYPYMPMMASGGMMGTGSGGCWLPVGTMMVNGTTSTTGNPVYEATEATVSFVGPATLWYVCMMPGHAQSGMYGLLTVRG